MRIVSSTSLSGGWDAAAPRELVQPEPVLAARTWYFACAVATAQAVEAFLQSTMLESDARLRSRYDDLVRGRGRGRRALVSRTGVS